MKKMTMEHRNAEENVEYATGASVQIYDKVTPRDEMKSYSQQSITSVVMEGFKKYTKIH